MSAHEGPQVPEEIWQKGRGAFLRELDGLGWVKYQGIAQGWFPWSAKGSRKQNPWEGGGKSKTGLLTPKEALKQPGHPSSESSCSWCLEVMRSSREGRGAAGLLAPGPAFSKPSTTGPHNPNGSAFLPGAPRRFWIWSI